MWRFIGATFSGVNAVFREKSFLCHVIENAMKNLVFEGGIPFFRPIFPWNPPDFFDQAVKAVRDG
jgi:hypothetical protein